MNEKYETEIFGDHLRSSVGLQGDPTKSSPGYPSIRIPFPAVRSPVATRLSLFFFFFTFCLRRRRLLLLPPSLPRTQLRAPCSMFPVQQVTTVTHGRKSAATHCMWPNICINCQPRAAHSPLSTVHIAHGAIFDFRFFPLILAIFQCPPLGLRLFFILSLGIFFFFCSPST